MLSKLALAFVQAAKGRAVAQAAAQATLGVTAAAAVSAGLGLPSSAINWAKTICTSGSSCAGGSYSKDNFPDAGPGPGSRNRSMQQSVEAGETSSTAGSGPARSPDAPADPTDLAGNRGSDPDEALRTAGMRAGQTMAGGYQNYPGPDTGGSLSGHLPDMAARFTEKVSGAAGVAAQAATGAAAVVADTVKAATGAAGGAESGQSVPHPSGDGTSARTDQSPLSDDAAPVDRHAWDQQWANTNADTRRSGEIDTASGTSDPEMLKRKTEQGDYKEAANRLYDMEGLERKY